jgi:hypothetical protein
MTALPRKAAAIKDFSDAVGKVNPAFDAAAQDINNPNPKGIYPSVAAFVAQVNDVHDKLKKAFGTP